MEVEHGHDDMFQALRISITNSRIKCLDVSLSEESGDVPEGAHRRPGLKLGSRSWGSGR
jgi:hypothetical protein